jgi:single-stranded-DNA-specific exonuclease
MSRRWRLRSHDTERIARLARAANIPAVLAQLLCARGVDQPEQVRAFLECKLTHLRDPGELPGMERAAEVVAAAVRGGKRIVIYGDYDVDGLTGASLLWKCLRLLGANVGCYVPHRLEEGYGLHGEALEQLARQGAQLVLTVDCGITSVAEAERAARLGMELVVTDHHQPGERLPDAAAILHPGLPGRPYAFAGLSGSGVAFKLAWALCQEASQARRVSAAMRELLLEVVGLAALGTVADVVPLLDENRILVHHGLNSLRASPGLGLERLMEAAGVDRGRPLSAEDLSFALAPRLNAAGRLGQAQLAFELLTTAQPHRAAALAAYLNELNSSRQSLERSTYLAALKQANEQFDPEGDPALVLAARGWHAGVIGIVAGRLAEKFHRPVILIALDELGIKPGIGSARSVPGFNLHEALAACGEHLLGYGGHHAAAGLRIQEQEVEAFRQAFCEYAAGELADADRQGELWIDAEVPLAALTLETVQQMERLAPFGTGNPRPVLCATELRVLGTPRTIGNGGRHLSMELVQHNVRLRAVAFGRGEQAAELAKLATPLDVAFQPVVNHFNGRSRVELHVTDWRTPAPLTV